MKLPKAYNQFGASMGRRETSASKEFEGKVILRQMSLNSGGYDNGGAYWGHGEPLYHAVGEADGEVSISEAGKINAPEWFEHFIRASDREDAKRQIKARYPKARFYR